MRIGLYGITLFMAGVAVAAASARVDRIVYIGTYTGIHPNAQSPRVGGPGEATITTFLWDAASGGLTAMGSVPTRPAGVTPRLSTSRPACDASG